MSKLKVTLMIKKPMAVVSALALLLSVVVPAMARESKVAHDRDLSAAPLQEQGPTDPAEMEAFLDDLFAQDMAENHVAGAAVAVVKDGKLFFAKGYGFADVDKKIPVDPEQTLFRVGSVGKTFTWTAVMQLVEQGKLDLDADVNTYLDFRIPDTYPEPIRLRHLLTHTSGFEQRLLGSAVSDPNDVVPGREFLISFMPARVRPPGEYVSYSNFNAVLAGYIVARVSGEPYEQYVQEHIFEPLGMAHSTALLEISPDLPGHISEGYTYAGGSFKTFPAYTGSLAGLPSGTHASTVTDMARFMIAHLQGGRYDDAAIPEARILKESTMQQMHSTLFTPDPRLWGVAHGFFDWSDNGQHTLGHRGLLPPMHSQMLLLPDQNLGVYVVYNSDGARPLTNPHSGFQKAFFDHYYPAPPVEPIQPPGDFSQRAARFVGSYRPTESEGTTVFRIFGLMDEYEVSDPDDGTLLFGMSRFVEVEPLYFRQVDGPFGIAFREDDQGRITHLFADRMPYTAFEKLDWYKTRSFHMVLFLGGVLMFLSMIPVAAVRFIRDRRSGANRRSAPRSARAAYWIILGVSLLNLLFLFGFALGMPAVMQNVLLDPPWIVKFALGLGVLAAVLTAGALVYTVLAWKDGYWGVAFRVYYTLVTVAALGFVWFLNYWNLLGWRY